MRKSYNVIALFLISFISSLMGHSATLNQNDFWPLYSGDYPFTHLNANQKEIFKDQTEDEILEIMHLSLSGFGQVASTGRDHEDKEVCQLGDIKGRWNMVGLLYGSVPTGQSRPALLNTAATQNYTDGTSLTDASYTDVRNQLGHFSVTAKYKKMGVRGKFQARVLNDFVFSVQGGIADIRISEPHLMMLQKQSQQEQVLLKQIIPMELVQTIQQLTKLLLKTI